MSVIIIINIIIIIVILIVTDYPRLQESRIEAAANVVWDDKSAYTIVCYNMDTNQNGS